MTGALASAPLVGSMLLAVCTWDKNCSGTITVPAGFTEIGTQHNNGPSISLALAWKIADGTETTFTSTIPGTISTCGLTVHEITGLNTSGLIDAVSILYVDDTNVTTRTTSTLGPTANADTLAIAIYNVDTIHNVTDGTSLTWTNGFVTAYTAPNGPNSGQVGYVLAMQQYSTVQASVSTTFSYTPGAADQAMTALILLHAATAPPPVNTVKWGLAYPPTTTGTRFSMELTSAAPDMQVQVLDYNTLAVVASSVASAVDSEFIGQANVSGLTPNTRYKWRVTTGTGQDTAFTGEFYTAWAVGTVITYDITCGSDNQINSADYTTYVRMAALNPRANFSVGDHPYIDETGNVPATFRSKYRTLLENASWRTLADKTPYAYMYDDHDFGGNDCDSTSASAPAVAAEYRRFYPVPVYGVTGTQAHSFVMGRVRHIFMDLRAERIIGTRIMSPTQMTWVKSELTQARNQGQVVGLHSSSPVLCTDISGQPDTWAPFFVERTAIYDHIQSLGMQNAVFWHHADSHMLAWDDGTNSHYSTDGSFGLPLFCAAAITQSGSVKGGPYSGGTLAGQHQFARLTFTEGATSSVTLRVRLIKGDDTSFADNTITLTPPTLSPPMPSSIELGPVGKLQVVGLTTTPLQITITPVVNAGGIDKQARYAGAFQLSSPSAWHYGSDAVGPVTLVAANQILTFPMPGPFVFYADAVTGTPNLEVLTVR